LVEEGVDLEDEGVVFGVMNYLPVLVAVAVV
jgi:hypothetical protein